MEFIIFSVHRHFINNIDNHGKNNGCYKNKKNLLILKHPEGRSSVLQITELQYILNNRNDRFVFQMYHCQIFRKLICQNEYDHSQHISQYQFIFFTHAIASSS